MEDLHDIQSILIMMGGRAMLKVEIGFYVRIMLQLSLALIWNTDRS